MPVRELTQKGDPMLRGKLPALALNMLQNRARENKRRVQEQFIKSIAHTFNQQWQYEASFEEILPNLKKMYQQ